MRPIRSTVSSQTAGNVIPLDHYADPFNVGLGVALSAGATLTYTVQHTMDDVTSPTFNAATATWFPHASLAAKTTSSDGNYAFPITALRLNVTAFTSGSATLTIIQAGMPGK